MDLTAGFIVAFLLFHYSKFRSFNLTIVSSKFLGIILLLISVCVDAQIAKPTLSDSDVRLFIAIRANDGQKVDSLITVGADPNASYFNHMTVLSYAAGLGNNEMVNKLLNAGADIDKTVGFSDPSALLSAIAAGQNEVVKNLLEHGADKTPETVTHQQGPVFRMNAAGFETDNLIPAIIIAADRGNLKAVQLLLQNGADPNIIFRSNYQIELKGKSALIIAAEKGHLDIVNELLAADADINQAVLNPFNGQPSGSAIISATIQGRKEVVKLLAESNANLNSKDAIGNTALHWAAGLVKEDIIPILLNNNAEINDKNNLGATPLMQAIQYKRLVGMWEAFHNRNRGNVIGKIHQFEGFISASKTNWGRVDSLKDVGKVDYELIEQDMKRFQYGYSVAPDLDFQRKFLEQQEIQGSIRAKSFLVIKELLKEGADISIKDNQNNSAVDIAKMAASDDAINVLLALQSSTEELPFLSRLNAALIEGSIPKIQDLIDNNITPEEAGTALGWVTSVKDQNFLPTLLSGNAQVNFQNKKGLSALHFAVYAGRSDLVDYLIQQQADVNQSDLFGTTPMAIAKREGYQEIIAKLTDAGANDQGNSLFDYAYSKSNLDTELLKLSNYANFMSVTDFNLRYYHADVEVLTSDILLGWLYQSFDSTAHGYYLQAILSRELLNLSRNSIIQEFETNMQIGRVSDVSYSIGITYNTGANPPVSVNANGATTFQKVEDLGDDDDAPGSIAIQMEGFRTLTNTVNTKWMRAFAGIGAVGGWNNHDWIFNDPDPRTSTIQYNVSGRMSIPGCAPQNNTFSACYPKLTIVNYKDRVPLKLRQAGQERTLLANDTLIMDRSLGPIQLINDWSDRVSGHGSTYASSTKAAEWSAIYPLTHDISLVPMSSDFKNRTRTYARIFAIKLFLEKNGGSLKSYELFGLNTAINILSEMARDKYKDVVRAELVGIVNFLENTDFTDFNNALIGLLENEQITLPEVRDALDRIINLDTTPQNLKDQLNDLNNQLNLLGIDGIIRSLRDYKSNYFGFLNNQILRYNDLLLEYSQFIPRDRLRDQLTLDRITIFDDKLSEYSKERLTL